jgi:hypothetical protein
LNVERIVLILIKVIVLIKEKESSSVSNKSFNKFFLKNAVKKKEYKKVSPTSYTDYVGKY